MATEEVQKTYLQYENIYNYFDHRGFTPKGNILNISQFEKDIIQNGYIVVSDTTNTSTVVLTFPKGKFSNIDAPMESKIRSILKEIKNNTKELLYLVDVSLIDGHGYTNMIRFRKKLMESYKNIWIQIRPRTVFYFNIPKCSEVPKHERINQADIRDALQRDYIEISDIPMIKENDPACVWEGARIGEIVKIYRYSRNVVEIDVYRRVVL